MLRIFLSCTLLTLVFSVFSQIESNRKFNYELGFSLGVNTFRPSNLNSDLDKISPHFINPSKNDTSFKFSSNKNYGIFNGSLVDLSLIILKNNGDKKGTFGFRFSYQFSDGIYASQTWTKQNSYSHDTLISKKDGSEYYIDSNASENYSNYYTTNLHKLNAGIHFYHQLNRKTNVYLGIDLGFGISSSAESATSQSTYYQLESRSNTNNINYYQTSNNQGYSSSYSGSKTKTLYSLSANLPIGIKYTFAKKDKTLSKLSISYEISVGNNLFFNQQIGKENQAYLRNSIGLKYLL